MENEAPTLMGPTEADMIMRDLLGTLRQNSWMGLVVYLESHITTFWLSHCSRVHLAPDTGYIDQRVKHTALTIVLQGFLVEPDRSRATRYH
jgi:hypothetical protein